MIQAREQVSEPLSPYNPWHSFLIEASAGSGKTWQLSRRFLALVVAGADPSSILTVTFTKKAAAEMRERIIRDAVKLGNLDPEFSDFVADIKRWVPAQQLGRQFVPRSPAEASRLILEKTQTLKITTIDALFVQWSQQFPIETAITLETNDGPRSLESPWDLLSNLGLERLNHGAWQDVLALAADRDQNRELMTSISENAPNGSIKSLARAIDPLTHSNTFLWYVQLMTGGEPIRFFDVPDDIDTPESLIAGHEDLFRAVINLMSNKDKRASALACIATKNFAGLIQEKVIKADGYGLNGNTFRSASKNAEPQFLELEQLLGEWGGHRRLAELNRTARLIWSLFKAREQAAHVRKISDAKGTFADAAKGVSLMASSDQAAGGRAMAWASVRHLMLDEFQDTSLLQWLIFHKLARELLAGESFALTSGPEPSVFIVGDKKQSIYRFREAAPEVMDMARQQLEPFGLRAQTMSESFRSSSLVLDLVNHVFNDQDLMADFPPHQPAQAAMTRNRVKSQYGTITLYPEATESETPSGETISEVINEARQVAQHIRDSVDGKLAMLVYDEHLKLWRRPEYRDFVVLYPRSTNSDLFEDEMRALAIPSRKEERKGFFARPEISDLQALVTWLSWPADSVALCTLLRSPIFGLSDRDLQDLLAVGSAGDLLPQLKEHQPTIYQRLTELRKTHDKEDMSKTIGHLINNEALADRYLKAFGPIEGPLARANILKWFDLVRDGSSDEALSAHSFSLALDEASEEDEIGNAALASNAVTLMTIHKSKGLEFPCVILTGTASDWHKTDSGWVKDTRPGHEGIYYIGTKDSRPRHNKSVDILLQQSEEASRREKARLLYVALTRATNHIVITGAQTKQIDQSFFPLITSAARQLINIEESKLTSGATMFLRGTPVDVNLLKSAPTELPSADHLQETPRPLGRPALKILTPSKRSHTQTERSEVDAPLRLAEQDLTPTLGSTYGTLVHKLIENHLEGIPSSPQRLKRLMLENSDTPLDESTMGDLLAAATAETNLLFSSTVWENLLASATKIHCEVPMAMIDGEDLLNAKADLLIEENNGSLTIVDFKTIKIPDIAQKNPDDQLRICHQLGYAQQVQDYCQLVRRAFGNDRVKGYVLLTSIPHLINLVPAESRGC